MVLPPSLWRLVDPAAGILYGVTQFRKPLWFSSATAASARINQAASAWFSIAAHGSVNPLLWAGRARKSGPGSCGAVSYDADDALLKTIGEGVERYCALIHDPNRHEMRAASHRELSSGGRVPPLEAFRLLSDQAYAALLERAGQDPRLPRFPVRQLRESDVLRWVRCTSLADGGPVWIPSIAVYLGGPARSAPAEIVSESMSTGLACHGSRDRALLAAICEVIERDCIMGMWLTRRAPPRLSRAGCEAASANVKRMLDELDRTTHRLTISDLTSDIGVPVAFATLTSDRRPHTIVGAGCSPSMGVAIEKAIIEVLMALAFEAATAPYGTQQMAADHLASDDDVLDLHDHGERYARWDLRDRFAFLLEAPEVPLPDDPPAATLDDAGRLAWVVDRVCAAGFDPCYFDLTIDEVARHGLHVVRAVIPGLLPLNAHSVHAPVAAPRLEAYQRLYAPARDWPERFSPWPHPFP